MRIRQRAYLGVWSEELSPEAISRLVGLRPDRATHRGSRSVDPPRPVASSWCLDATGGRPVDEQVDELLARIEPVAAALADLLATRPVTGRIQVVRELDHPDGVEEERGGIGSLEKPSGQHQLLGFFLDVGVLGRLASIGLGLDVDEYG